MELTKTVILFVGFFVVVISGLPAKKDEVEYVPPVTTYGDKPIVDTGLFSGWENPFGVNPFGGLFDSLEGIMERMRQQLATLLSKFPYSRGNSTDDDFPALPDFGHAAFPGFGGIDLSKGNTSSVTKVIDGQTVVINETEYKKEDDFGGTFFKVRVIDVKPNSDEATTERESQGVPADATTKDREDVADSIENEIPKSKEVQGIDQETLKKSNKNQLHTLEVFEDIESFENTANAPLITAGHHQPKKNIIEFITNRNTEWSEDEFDTENPQWSYIHPVKSLDSNSIDFKDYEKQNERQIPIDLSRDTYVNEILAQNGAPINPDAEIFIVEDVRHPKPLNTIIDPR